LKGASLKKVVGSYELEIGMGISLALELAFLVAMALFLAYSDVWKGGPIIAMVLTVALAIPASIWTLITSHEVEYFDNGLIRQKKFVRGWVEKTLHSDKIKTIVLIDCGRYVRLLYLAEDDWVPTPQEIGAEKFSGILMTDNRLTEGGCDYAGVDIHGCQERDYGMFSGVRRH
jgi:hypothetical protein